MKTEISYYITRKIELHRINEGLKNRCIDADSVISITDNGDSVTVWYKVNIK